MYRIDSQDEIVFANDESLQFSFDNGATNFKPVNVINKSLWNFITDDLTRQLYEVILRRARKGDTIGLSFRCDFADCRRFIELNITALQNGAVQFETKTLCRHEIEPVQALDLEASRCGEEFLRICGWCKRIDVGVVDWHELENAVMKLKLFERDRLPQLTHGICRTCYETMTDKLVQKRQPDVQAKA